MQPPKIVAQKVYSFMGYTMPQDAELDHDDHIRAFLENNVAPWVNSKVLMDGIFVSEQNGITYRHI